MPSRIDLISVPTSATFTGTQGNITVSGTATGNVSQPTFTGTGVRLVTGNIPVSNDVERHTYFYTEISLVATTKV